MKLKLSIAICVAIANVQAQTTENENTNNQKESAVIIAANFTANKTTVCVGETVQFTDNSTGSPSTWAWQFSGGSPASSTSQNPAIQYSAPGTYNVILTASNGNDQNTIGKLSFIRVEACTSLEFNSKEGGVRVFPVPAKNLVYLQSYSDGKFTILNLSGQVLQSGTVVANQTTEVSIEQLAPGFFFFEK